LTDPQIWTLIGVVCAMVFGVLGWQSIWFMRILRTEFGGLRDVMEARFESVDRRIDGVDKRLDHLDRDVQALTRRAFGGETPPAV
jgi:hypothetical protein